MFIRGGKSYVGSENHAPHYFSGSSHFALVPSTIKRGKGGKHKGSGELQAWPETGS
jgi:hypothetical protein